MLSCSVVMSRRPRVDESSIDCCAAHLLSALAAVFQLRQRDCHRNDSHCTVETVTRMPCSVAEAAAKNDTRNPVQQDFGSPW
jgi:hypothetical protein